MTDETTFVDELAALTPDLDELLRQHRDEFEGVLPHLFLADVERWAEAKHRHAGNAPELKAVLDHIEIRYSESPELQELIAVSFVELLPNRGDEGGGLRDLVGPNLARQIEAFEEPPH